MKIKKEKEIDKGQDKSVDSVLKDLQKSLGEGVVFMLGDQEIKKYDVIPTGSILIDNAIGIGGCPRGRIVEFYGEPSGGKTTVLLHVINMAQKLGLRAAFVDAEHALDLTLAKNIGVDTKNLVVSQPDYGEQALEITEKLVESGLFGIVGVDSVAALIPKAELEGDLDDQQIGLQARMLGKSLRRLVAKANRTNTCVVFINQTRSKIGGFGYGGDTTTPGGKALKFFSSVRLDVRRIGSIKQGEEVVGSKVKIAVTKNKCAPPFRTVETEIVFGIGINTVGEVLDTACELGLVEKSGMWYSHNDERIGQGRAQACDWLRTHVEVYDSLLQTIQQKEVPNVGQEKTEFEDQ